MPAVQRRDDYFIVHPVIPQAFALAILLVILLIVSWIVVGLRCLARWRIRSFGKDDWFMLGALVSIAPFGITWLTLVEFFYTALIAFCMVNHVLVPGRETTGNRDYMLFVYVGLSSRG
jgi:hypothetical protein